MIFLSDSYKRVDLHLHLLKLLLRFLTDLSLIFLSATNFFSFPIKPTGRSRFPRPPAFKVLVRSCAWFEKVLFYQLFNTAAQPHLSPGVSFIYDLAHDSGMLQSELFTSRNQNLVLAKLPNSGFWRYDQFFK